MDTWIILTLIGILLAMDPGEEGNDQGEVHSCAYPKSCKAHSCGPPPGMAYHELTTVAGLIPELTFDALITMHHDEPNLLLNVERSAVQVLGCHGLVVASVELTPFQKAQLANASMRSLADGQ